MKHISETQMNDAFRLLPYDLKEHQDCPCLFHRYHIAHICECGQLYSHSQSECDEHRFHDCISFDSGFYQHGDTAKGVFDKLTFYGVLPYGTKAMEKVYTFACDNW